MSKKVLAVCLIVVLLCIGIASVVIVKSVGAVRDSVFVIMDKVIELQEEQQAIINKIDRCEVEAEKEPELVCIGNYKITAYCHCEKCCGRFADGITASGTVATPNRTAAVDPAIIPYGTKLYINGQEYIAEDCGSAIKENHIDLYFGTHQEALQWGVQYFDVYIEQ